MGVFDFEVLDGSLVFSINEGLFLYENVLVWVEVAIIAALSMAMSFIPDFAGWFHRRGEQLFLLFSLRRGLTPGLATGLLWGLLHFALGKVAFLSVEQVLIEYVIAFAVMGLAGLL